MLKKSSKEKKRPMIFGIFLSIIFVVICHGIIGRFGSEKPGGGEGGPASMGFDQRLSCSLQEPGIFLGTATVAGLADMEEAEQQETAFSATIFFSSLEDTK